MIGTRLQLCMYVCVCYALVFHSVTLYLFCGIPTLHGSQIKTRYGDSWTLPNTSFKIPANRLQSLLYWHQCGERDLSSITSVSSDVNLWMISTNCFTSVPFFFLQNFLTVSESDCCLGAGVSRHESRFEGYTQVLQVS